jgi:hypothetical protein
MPNTFYLLASNTVGAGGVASVTFSSIPQTYTDLIIKFSGRSDFSGVVRGLSFFFNGDTTTGNYANKRMYGEGSGSAQSDNSTYALFVNANTSTANSFGNGEIYIPNYTGSNNKSYSADYVIENNAATAYAGLDAGIRNNTAAITSIYISPEPTSNFMQYSTFYLYGITNS